MLKTFYESTDKNYVVVETSELIDLLNQANSQLKILEKLVRKNFKDFNHPTCKRIQDYIQLKLDKSFTISPTTEGVDHARTN